MPLQNRVDPFGALFRTPARGTMLGNRGGAIHDEQREIVRQYKTRRWITCVLEYKGRRRMVMSPRRYTELFFLDEAVAFAAGHRPCAECRHARFKEFQHSWPSPENRADQMDAVLQPARIDRRGKKVTFHAPINSLPNGSFVQIEECPYLVWDTALLLWTPQGYARKISRDGMGSVTVLTPEPIVQCFQRGYTPVVHNSCWAI